MKEQLLALAVLSAASSPCGAVENVLHIPNKSMSVWYSYDAPPTEYQAFTKEKLFAYTAAIQEPGAEKKTRFSLTANDMPDGNEDSCKKSSFDQFAAYDAKIDPSSVSERRIPVGIRVDFLERGTLLGKPIKSEQSAVFVYRGGVCIMARISRYPFSDNDREVINGIAASIKVSSAGGI